MNHLSDLYAAMIARLGDRKEDDGRGEEGGKRNSFESGI